MEYQPSLTSIQKRSVFKIAVDLIKADNRIHCKEISVLDKLQDKLSLTQEELDSTHYLTLADAVNCIKAMETERVKEFVGLFSNIMRVDSDISFKENLLLTAVVMACDEDSKGWVHIISNTTTETKVSDTQIVFLEKEYVPDTHMILDDKYDNLLISKAFTDIGLELFYLPSILGELGMCDGNQNSSVKRFGLLQKSMSYLMPSGNKSKIDNIEKILDSFDTTTFFKVVLTGLNLDPDLFPYDSFLLLKVHESRILDDRNNGQKVTDFICIDISREIKKRILAFVSYFNERSAMLPYDGYYKLLYDHLSSEAKITSSIFIDHDMNFILENIGESIITFESSPQSRTFYLLLLFYGRLGLSQSTINQAIDYLQAVELPQSEDRFDIEEIMQRLLSKGSKWSLLIYNTISIYRAISTKNEQKANYLSYISSILNHRSSLKTYVNKGFSGIEGLANPEQYHIRFDKEFNTYRVDISASFFFCMENGQRLPLTSSTVWKSMK